MRGAQLVLQLRGATLGALGDPEQRQLGWIDEREVATRSRLEAAACSR